MLIKKIIEKIINTEQFNDVLSEINKNKIVNLSGVYGAFVSFFVYAVFSHLGDSCLLLFPDEEIASEAIDDLAVIDKEMAVLSFPAYKRDAWNEVGPHSSIVGEKTNVLKNLSNGSNNTVIVTSPEALLEKMISKEAHNFSYGNKMPTQAH